MLKNIWIKFNFKPNKLAIRALGSTHINLKRHVNRDNLVMVEDQVGKRGTLKII